MVAQNTPYTTKESRKEFYQNILQKYGNSTLQYLFDSQEDFLFEYYIDGNSEDVLIDNLCTVLHEYAHYYNEEDEHGISHFVDENGSILFPYTETFTSDQLNNVVRNGLQDSIYRYHLYVGSKNKLASGHTLDKKINTKEHNQMSSIVSGIYGMFEEFSAYYIGTLTDYCLFGYYRDTYGNGDKEAMHEYIGELSGNTIAFYEFSLFMGWYLQHARSNYPDIYRQIMDNQNFRVAFTIKYNQFQNLVLLAENRLDSLHSIYGSNYKNELDYSGSEEDFLKFLTLNIF
jgi:hypothetical protein